jgi:FlaA1/EpsC-like NDP-sugar epimerase
MKIKDPFTLMWMIEFEIFNTDITLLQFIENNSKKYFCVSTDKAAIPENRMRPSKTDYGNVFIAQKYAFSHFFNTAKLQP